MEDGTTFLAFCEAVLCESPERAEVLDRLFTEARTAPATPASAVESRSARNREIQKALRVFGAA